MSSHNLHDKPMTQYYYCSYLINEKTRGTEESRNLPVTIQTVHNRVKNQSDFKAHALTAILYHLS